MYKGIFFSIGHCKYQRCIQNTLVLNNTLNGCIILRNDGVQISEDDIKKRKRKKKTNVQNSRQSNRIIKTCYAPFKTSFYSLTPSFTNLTYPHANTPPEIDWAIWTTLPGRACDRRELILYLHRKTWTDIPEVEEQKWRLSVARKREGGKGAG